MADNKERMVVERIKNSYETKPQQLSKFEELKALDNKVKRPVNIFSYVFGGIGSLVLGTGMSIAMGVIGGSVALGVIVGLAGIAMVSTNYPLYKKILNSRKEKYSKEIISRSNELLNKENTYQCERFVMNTKTNIQENNQQVIDRAHQSQNQNSKDDSFER